MNLGQSLVTSGLGLLVVMSVLVILAIAIIVVTKVLNALGLGSDNKAAPAVQNTNKKKDELDEESYAVIIATVCEEIQQPPDKFRITEIKEVSLNNKM